MLKKSILFYLLILLGLQIFSQEVQQSQDSLKRINGNILENSNVVEMIDSLAQVNFFDDTLTIVDTAKNLTNINLADTIFLQRIYKLNLISPFPFVYNDDVRKFIDLYAGKRSKLTGRMLGLSAYYFPLFEEYLDKYNIPLELKYLAIVESALNPIAKSRAGAGGLWQFMLGTGKMYGLKVNSYMDDRFDPVKATDAACRHFIDLYKMYNDWALVLAAYNSGAGNVNKAIRRANGEMEFWKIKEFLPRETQGYVPAFIAVVYCMTYAQELGIEMTNLKYSYNDIDTVYIRKPLSFGQIAEYLKIPFEEVDFFNPIYKQGFIPADSTNLLPLRLKSSDVLTFIDKEKEIYNFKTTNQIQYEQFLANLRSGATQGSKFQRDVHIVKKGESLGSVAKKYNCTVNDIKSWNKMSNSTIHTGQKLIVERPIKQYSANTNNNTVYSTSGPSQASIKISQASKSGKEVKYIYHTVQSGDTLWDIANKYKGLTVEEIKQINNLANPRSLKLGQKLKVGIVG